MYNVLFLQKLNLTVLLELASEATFKEEAENEINIFSEWLEKSDGLRKTPKDAKAISTQIRRILYTVNPNGNLADLMDKDKIQNDFLEPHRKGENGFKKLLPNQINCYILALNKFCLYIISKGGISYITVTKAQSIRGQCEIWTRSIQPDIKKWRFDRKAEISSELIR